MVVSRRWAGFLVLVGVWTWVIWPRFSLAIWNDPRGWSTRHVGHGSPTSFLWVHAVLILVSLVIGTTVGVLGIRAWRAAGRPADVTSPAPAAPLGADGASPELAPVRAER